MLKWLHYQKQHYISLKMQIKCVSFHGILVTFSLFIFITLAEVKPILFPSYENNTEVTVPHYQPWDKLASFCTDNSGKDISMALQLCTTDTEKKFSNIQLIKKGKKSVKLLWFISAKDVPSILYLTQIQNCTQRDVLQEQNNQRSC